MTIKEIIEVLIIERNCVERQDTPLCDRNCANCDLVMPTGRVVKAYEQAIDILHQEPCDDAISREYLFKVLDDFCGHDRTATIMLDTLADIVYELPSVTPSRRYGAWIGIDEEPHEDFECCVCGKAIYAIEDLSEYKFCPNCGAEMESEE